MLSALSILIKIKSAKLQSENYWKEITMDSSLNDLNPKFISSIFKTLMSWIWWSVKNVIESNMVTYRIIHNTHLTVVHIGDLKKFQIRIHPYPTIICMHNQLFMYNRPTLVHRPWMGLSSSSRSSALVAQLPPCTRALTLKNSPLSGPYPTTHNLWSHMMISELN